MIGNLFDRTKLRLMPLSERNHDLDLNILKNLREVECRFPELIAVAKRVCNAYTQGASVILMLGGHVLRSGVQRYIIDLMEKGLISCFVFNGAAIIHDYELALIGATTESVSKYISEGQFGLWDEISTINEIISDAKEKGYGLGESIGRAIYEGEFPHKDISLFARGYLCKIPMTVHIGIGCDIIHEHPNYDAAAVGVTSYMDFLKFVHVMERLEGGVVMNFGSAVMAPEVFLKALAMVRNVAHFEKRKITNFATLVCDLHNLPENYATEPQKDDPNYYFRPWKTMLVRTVADGGKSFYVRGDHAETIPQLWTAIVQQMPS